MSNKERILALVTNLPDEVSVAEVIDRLQLLKSIEEGSRQADAGEFLDHDAFMEELLKENE